MTDTTRPKVGTFIRVLDHDHLGLPEGTLLEVIPEGEFQGMFGADEITVAELGVDPAVDGHWYPDLALEGIAWERVEEA